MLLDGKYHEAARLGYDEWHKTAITGGMGMGGGRGFSMRVEYPKTASVRNYLRTVDFESTELKVHWTDERGEWVRETFASRPDNVVVQRLTAPQGQPLNVRITMGRSAGGGRGGGMGMGAPGAAGRGGAPGAAQGISQQDFNEQRFIFKGVFDPSINNSGYAGVTRVVRNGGAARMDGDTLVVENASSVILLTRIEPLPEYSEARVEAVRRAVEALTPDYAALLARARKVQSEMLNRVTVDYRQERELHLRSILLAGEQPRQPRPVLHARDQLQHGYFGLPGSAGQSGAGLRAIGHRSR